jgi:hypothetical protein
VGKGALHDTSAFEVAECAVPTVSLLTPGKVVGTLRFAHPTAESL